MMEEGDWPGFGCVNMHHVALGAGIGSLEIWFGTLLWHRGILLIYEWKIMIFQGEMAVLGSRFYRFSISRYLLAILSCRKEHEH